MDITSLYTVIPNGEGLLALKHFFDLRTVKEPSSETLLRLAELVLTLNCFSFATSYYKQINVVAMGTKMGPSYANLFVGYIEHQFFNQYNGPKPELYRRCCFPFRKRSMPFLTVVAIIGNQAFQNGRCHICFSLGLDKVETGIIC